MNNETPDQAKVLVLPSGGSPEVFNVPESQHGLYLLVALVPAGYQYYTCLIHNCSAQPHTAPFSGPIDHGSLTVQDEYIFLKVSVQVLGGEVHNPLPSEESIKQHFTYKCHLAGLRVSTSIW